MQQDFRSELSKQRRLDIISALRRGTVRNRVWTRLPWGWEKFHEAILQELNDVQGGRAVFKAVRGE